MYNNTIYEKSECEKFAGSKESLAILKRYFGYESFREGQEQIIDSLLAGRDVLGIMPTGGGKSLCYQIPAMLMPGTTIVISPLISLMQDQVTALNQMGISAAFINSSLSYNDYNKTMYYAASGSYKIIYVAPERLLTDRFLELCEKIEIPLVAVDEAHCVSQWGQNFRPSYLKIKEFIANLGKRPVVGAFTATATKRVKDDIIELLSLQHPKLTVTGFNRPNLYFEVRNVKNKDMELLKDLKKYENKSGIVYCATRKDVESVCTLLCARGIEATRYHAGLSEMERKANQEDFVYDRKPVIVATNAFGMGIDKSNVSFVIHYSMPRSMEAYYQEAGRAGRDGEKADCILYYAARDVELAKWLIKNSEPNPDLSEEEQRAVRDKDFERLKYMTFYATTKDCLREYILNYFGERGSFRCGNCGSCLGEFEYRDITEDARKILNCIYESRQRYGRKKICGALKGSQAEAILKFGLDRLKTYGSMSAYTEKSIEQLISGMLEEGYLASEGSEYPILKITQKAYDFEKNKDRIRIRVPKESLKSGKLSGDGLQRKQAKGAAAFPEGDVDAQLFDILRKLRMKIARTNGVPPFVIFGDATLKALCVQMPSTEEELLEVYGIGESKAAKYGKAFLEAINDYKKA